MPAPVRAAVTTATAVLALVGCSSSKSLTTKTSTTPTPKTSTTAAAGTPTNDQLKATLISASDITVDKFTLTNTSPVNQMGAVGISGIFGNANHNRVLSVILIHYPSAAYAQAGLSEIQALAAGQLTHNPAKDTPVKVGEGAHLYEGANDVGPLSILVFAEGNYDVTMEFVSKNAGDSVPTSVVLALGTKQDQKVKAAS